MKKTKRYCAICVKPIEPPLSFCREDWFKIPSSLRDKITSAKNIFERGAATKAALDWFHMKQTGATP